MSLYSQISIQVVGSINMDLVVKVPRFPNSGETITGTTLLTASGGKGANQAIAAAKLGAKVVFVGNVGNDDFGKQQIRALQKEGANTQFISTVSSVNTGTAIITIDQNAHNQIIVIPGANHTISKKQVEKAFKSIKMQALLLQLEIPLDIVTFAATLAKNIGSLVILNPAPAIPIPDKLINLVDYLIPNEHEALLLTGKTTIEDAGKNLIKRGAKNVIVTLGKKGAVYFDKKPIYVPAFKVKAIDPTAAGDAFIASFAVTILQGHSLLDAIKFANAAGALASTKIGAQPSLPTLAEIKQFVASSSV